MKNIKEIISTYRGSKNTYALVKEQLQKKYGSKVANSFDPKKDVMTYRLWEHFGFRVKKGEKALKSFTFIDVEDEDEKEKKIRREINLFHRKQVEQINN